MYYSFDCTIFLINTIITTAFCVRSRARLANPTRININRARAVLFYAIDYGHFPPVMKRLAYHNNRLVGGFYRRSSSRPLLSEGGCWCDYFVSSMFPRISYVLSRTRANPLRLFIECNNFPLRPRPPIRQLAYGMRIRKARKI